MVFQRARHPVSVLAAWKLEAIAPAHHGSHIIEKKELAGRDYGDRYQTHDP